MLFGPMAIAELKLPDDNPEAFKTCNENCNEVSISILPSDIDQAMMVISGNYHSCITNLNATTAHLLSKDIQPILNCLAIRPMAN